MLSASGHEMWVDDFLAGENSVFYRRSWVIGSPRMSHGAKDRPVVTGDPESSPGIDHQDSFALRKFHGCCASQEDGQLAMRVAAMEDFLREHVGYEPPAAGADLDATL